MNAVDHNNVVIFDDRGIPSIMCRFVRPKDTEEVPAVFKIGDKVADAIYISKYPNIVIDGRAYSMPMADPTVNITFDEAVQACRCKGLGWHLMTAVEYEYLLNQSREKGTMPHGNTDWGKDYYHNEEQGKVSNLGRTYTGTGPVTWNHDHTPYGVSDLNGLEIPYIPCLDVQVTALPYFKLKCLKCGQISLSCAYMAKHKGCGGYYTVDFATKIYRERAKEKELA